MDAKEKINTILTILCDALSDCANLVGGNNFLLRKIHSKLPTEAVHINIENGDFLLVSQLLNAIGNILQFDEEKQVCTAVVGSGFANMNPALVVAMMENQTLYLAASAKEGLIKQHTGSKALTNTVDYLQELEKKAR